MANESLFTGPLPNGFGPDVVAGDPTFAAMITAFTTALQGFLAYVDPNQLNQLLIKPNINNLPEELIDELAVEFGAIGYDYTYPIDLKRSIVQTACYDNAHLGTPDSVQTLVNRVFGQATVEEWWQYGGQPYHFRIRTTDPQTDPTNITDLNAAILATKPVSRWPDGVARTRDCGNDLLYCGCAIFRQRQRRWPAAIA